MINIHLPIFSVVLILKNDYTITCQMLNIVLYTRFIIMNSTGSYSRLPLEPAHIVEPKYHHRAVKGGYNEERLTYSNNLNGHYGQVCPRNLLPPLCKPCTVTDLLNTISINHV